MKNRRVFGIVVVVAALGLAGCDGEREAAERTTPTAGDTIPLSPEVTPPVRPGEIDPDAIDTVAADEAIGDGPEREAAPGPAPRRPDASTPRASEPRGDAAPVSEILARVERRYAPLRSIQADFQQRVHVRLLGEDRTSRGTLYQRRPNLFAMQFSDPDGDVIVADGRYLWMYHPSVDDRQVMRAPLGNGAREIDFHREFLERAEERYDVRRDGSASVAGRTTDVLRLDPKTESQYRQVRIWVDREDSFVRRFEITEENGNVRTVELRNIRTDVSIPDRVFRFDPPEGARVFSQ